MCAGLVVIERPRRALNKALRVAGGCAYVGAVAKAGVRMRGDSRRTATCARREAGSLWRRCLDARARLIADAPLASHCLGLLIGVLTRGGVGLRARRPTRTIL